MTSVAILGTSHVAALHQGWSRIETDWPGVSVTCFAAPGKQGRSARLRGRRYGYFGRKAPKAKVFGHDKPTITLTDYDHVVRVGRTFPEAALVPVLESFAIDGITPEGSDRPRVMSHAAGIAMIEALAARAVPSPEWLGWDSPHLTLMQVPYPDTRFATAKVAKRHASRQWLAQRPEEMLVIRPIILQAIATALALHDVGFVAQPSETLGPDGLSLLAYSEGSLRMVDGTDHDQADLIHMNADYGALAMTRLMQYLTGDTATRPAHAATG